MRRLRDIRERTRLAAASARVDLRKMLMVQIGNSYRICWVLPAADEICARVESLFEALAVPAEVVGQEVFVYLAAVAEDAVALAATARSHLRDDEDAGVHGGAVGDTPLQAGRRQV